MKLKCSIVIVFACAHVNNVIVKIPLFVISRGKKVTIKHKMGACSLWNNELKARQRLAGLNLNLKIKSSIQELIRIKISVFALLFALRPRAQTQSMKEGCRFAAAGPNNVRQGQITSGNPSPMS